MTFQSAPVDGFTLDTRMQRGECGLFKGEKKKESTGCKCKYIALPGLLFQKKRKECDVAMERTSSVIDRSMAHLI